MTRISPRKARAAGSLGFFSNATSEVESARAYCLCSNKSDEGRRSLGTHPAPVPGNERMHHRQPSRFLSRQRVARGQAESRDSSSRIAPGNQESAQPCPAPHGPARWKSIEVAALLPCTVRQRPSMAPRVLLQRAESLSFLALSDLQDLIGLDVLQNLNPSAGPAQLNFFDSCVTAQPKMDALIRGTSETPRSGYMVVLHQAGFSCDFDAR